MPDTLLTAYDPSTVMEVCHRVQDLMSIGQFYKDSQLRVRKIMDGGRDGLRALAGRTGEADFDALDNLPAGNPILSGLTHLSTKLQQVPDLKVEPDKDTDTARRAAETRENALWHMDEAACVELQQPQIGLWLPGYGFTARVMTERRDANGMLYPHVELRDPIEAYPGDWGVDQQPVDIAFVRHMDAKTLIRMYPEHARALLSAGARQASLPQTGDSSSWAHSGWSNRSHGAVQVAEYFDDRGCWWVVPDRGILLEFKPNLLSRPMFRVAKRFAFNRLQGQYDHVIGLMATMARLTVMQTQWIQDSVHTETNVFGQAPAEYRKGRYAINEMEPGTRVEKPVNAMPFQAFQAIDRLERQMRTTARYPVTDDAQSPASWATGAGIEELGQSMSAEIQVYQKVLRYDYEAWDSLRLEWLERHYKSKTVSMVGVRKGARYAETFKPSQAIAGRYKTRRKYGFMAGWDESRKLVGGLQLVAGGIISKTNMRENLDGLDESLMRIEEQLGAEKAEQVIMDTLLQMAAQGDPRALAAGIDMLPAGETKNILSRYFQPEPEQAQEEAAAAETEQMMSEGPSSLDDLMSNPQILARLSQSGSPNSGGVQVMTEMNQ